MPADVNVTEKVARALTERDHLQRMHGPGAKCWHKESKYDRLPYWREVTAAALAVLSDPEALAALREAADEDCAPDCDERTSCDKTGLGHSMCGRCEHGEPRHHGEHFHCAIDAKKEDTDD